MFCLLFNDMLGVARGGDMGEAQAPKPPKLIILTGPREGSSHVMHDTGASTGFWEAGSEQKTGVRERCWQRVSVGKARQDKLSRMGLASLSNFCGTNFGAVSS